jgi:hypothetical protein
MIDPGWLGSVGPIVAATGAGLLIRRGLAVRERHLAERDAEITPPPVVAPRPTPRPAPRPAVRVAQVGRR